MFVNNARQLNQIALGSNTTAPNRLGTSSAACESGNIAYELVLLTLTIPFWTFITFYLLLLLTHYLRKIQHFVLFDRCTPKNAHFRYDFRVVLGKYSANYSPLESHLIVDLLDNQLISTMTFQIPGSTIFNESQICLRKHPRPNLRFVCFTIYRRHPIKDVRCIRIAHSCGNQDSRLYVYGVNLYDSTNGENKFFPITSLVKYRGTQWALNTTFEPKHEANFSKIGCDPYDSFETSQSPTFIEILILIFYIWCSVFCFGHLISVDAIWESIPFHTLTITFISGSSAIVIAFIHLRLIKTHIIDQHYESCLWLVLKYFTNCLVLLLSISFWSLATRQIWACERQSINWMISSLISASVLTLTLFIVKLIVERRKRSNDELLFEENDNNLAKTNSLPNMEFVKETPKGLFQKFQTQTNVQKQAQFQVTKTAKASGSSKAGKMGNGSTSSKAKKSSSNRKTSDKRDRDRKDDEDVFVPTDSKYMKTRNRNSISQYV